MKKVLIFFVIYFQFSCTEYCYHNPNNVKRVDGYELVTVDSVSFPLDSKTSNLISVSSYDPKNNNFSFLSNNYEILVFDYFTQKELKRISTQGIGVSSYEFINNDSIFLFDYSKNQLVLINSQGDILECFLIRPNIQYYPSPIVKIAPIVKQGNNIIFTGNMSGEYSDETNENRLVTGIYDLETKKVRYEIPYPEIYEKYNWGGGMFRWVYAAYNERLEQIIYSFPADHYIQVAEKDFLQMKSFLAGSKYIDYLKSYSRYKSKPIDSEDKIKQFVENYTYSNILYDQYNDVYYRIAEMKTLYDGMPGWGKEISVIILDRNFHVIGETYIGKVKSTYRYALFVNYLGLHILKDSSEDFMKFEIYKFRKK